MSVKVRKIGNTYGIIVHHQGQRWKQSVGSKQAAKTYAAEIELQLARGRVGLQGEIPTFGEYYPSWIEYITLVRAPTTARRYKGLAERAAKYLGNKTLNTITRGDIRDLLLKEHRKGAAPASIELLHTVISGIFHHAIDDGHITQAPTTRIIAKLDLRKQKPEVNPLSSDEMRRVLEVVEEQLYPLFFFLFQTGARIGEALAVSWGDIDLVGKKITLNKTAKDQQIRQTTKTKSARSIDMSDALLPVLQQLKEIDAVECRARRVKPGLVFHKKGKILSDNTLRRKWTAACQEIGLGHRTLHDIRHTTASLLLARLVPVTYVSAMLGHSSPKITLDVYSHYIPSESMGLINTIAL